MYNIGIMRGGEALVSHRANTKGVKSFGNLTHKMILKMIDLFQLNAS